MQQHLPMRSATGCWDARALLNMNRLLQGMVAALDLAQDDYDRAAAHISALPCFLEAVRQHSSLSSSGKTMRLHKELWLDPRPLA